MGIDTALRNRVYARKPGCADCFRTDAYVQRGEVVIFDFLVRVRALMGPRRDYTFDLPELVDAMWHEARQLFEDGRASVVVYCMDQEDLVPAQKGAEQKRRDRARRNTAVPYPDGTRIVDEGVRVTREDGTRVVERLDMKRLMGNRRLRQKLWDRLRKALARATTATGPGPHPLAVPRGCTFLLDHFKQGTYEFTPGRVRLLDQAPSRLLGEADLKVPCWVLHYASSPANITVQSIDSDYMPILTMLLCRLGPKAIRGKVRLHYWKERWLDLTAFARYMATHKDEATVGPRRFVLHCILGGTDFVIKDLIFKGIGVEKLHDYLAQEPELLDAVWDASPANLAPLGRVVQRVYARHWCPKRPPREVRMRELWTMHQDTKLYDIPRRNRLQEVWEAVRFNLKYWTPDWTDEARYPRTLPQGQVVHVKCAPQKAKAAPVAERKQAPPKVAPVPAAPAPPQASPRKHKRKAYPPYVPLRSKLSLKPRTKRVRFHNTHV